MPIERKQGMEPPQAECTDCQRPALVFQTRYLTLAWCPGCGLDRSWTFPQGRKPTLVYTVLRWPALEGEVLQVHDSFLAEKEAERERQRLNTSLGAKDERWSLEERFG